MIDVSSLTCSLQTYKRWHADEKRWVIQQLCAMFGISDHEIDNCLIIRKSLDARHKGALTMLYHVRIALKQGAFQHELELTQMQAFLPMYSPKI